jgi:hypothetical protein
MYDFSGVALWRHYHCAPGGSRPRRTTCIAARGIASSCCSTWCRCFTVLRLCSFMVAAMAPLLGRGAQPVSILVYAAFAMSNIGLGRCGGGGAMDDLDHRGRILLGGAPYALRRRGSRIAAPRKPHDKDLIMDLISAAAVPATAFLLSGLVARGRQGRRSEGGGAAGRAFSLRRYAAELGLGMWRFRYPCPWHSHGLRIMVQKLSPA